MPRRDRRGSGKIGKAWKGRCQRVLGFDLQARVGRVVVEEPQRQRMQHGKKGDAGIVCKRVAQGERMVSGQLDHQPVGQSSRVAVFILGGCEACKAPLKFAARVWEAAIVAGDGDDMHPFVGGLFLLVYVAALDAKQAVVAQG